MRILPFFIVSILLFQEFANGQPTGNEKLYLDIFDAQNNDVIYIGRSIPANDFKGKNRIKPSFEDRNYVVIDQSMYGAIGFERYAEDSLPHKTLMTDDHQLCIIRSQKDTMTIWLENVRGTCYLKIPFQPGQFVLRVDDQGNSLIPHELLPQLAVNGNVFVDNLTPKNWENYRYAPQENQKKTYNLLEAYKPISQKKLHFSGFAGNGRYKSEIWVEDSNITMALYDTLHNSTDYYYRGKIYQENDSVYNVKFESLLGWSFQNMRLAWENAPHDPMERLQDPGPSGFLTDTVSARFLVQVCFFSKTAPYTCFPAPEGLTELNNSLVAYDFDLNGQVYDDIQVIFNWFGREFRTRIHNFNPESANTLYYIDLSSNVYGSTTTVQMTDSTLQMTPSAWWITPGFKELKMTLTD